MSSPQKSVIRVWDLPTRLFHWLFAVCVIGAIVTVKSGNVMLMEWHIRFGIIALALLVFRVIWGLTGSRYARFTNFVRCPSAVIGYLKARSWPTPGHNPLGALSVIALLLCIGVQSVTGLFVTDDILYQGPFHGDVAAKTATLMRTIHQFNQYVVVALVLLHLVAIAIYRIKGQRLVRTMVTGDAPASQYAPDSPDARDDLGIRAWALLLATGLGVLAWWLIDRALNGAMNF